MFCTGEAPTVPGISAMFSSPGQPCSIVQATKSCQRARRRRPRPSSRGRSRAAGAGPWISTLSTSFPDVAGQHDVAAAAQHEGIVGRPVRVADQRLQLGLGTDARQPWRARDAKRC